MYWFSSRFVISVIIYRLLKKLTVPLGKISITEKIDPSTSYLTHHWTSGFWVLYSILITAEPMGECHPRNLLIRSVPTHIHDILIWILKNFLQHYFVTWFRNTVGLPFFIVKYFLTRETEKIIYFFNRKLYISLTEKILYIIVVQNACLQNGLTLRKS